MSKVVYVTPELRYEVQRWDEDESYNNGYTAVSGTWTPRERYAREDDARRDALARKHRSTLNKYRVVDLEAEEN